MSQPDCLVVTGVLNTRTIWPHGISDADTLRLQVNTEDHWAYMWHNGVFRRTRLLDNAVVHGAVVKPVVSNAGTVSIRLEGIDAPELHYRAPPCPRDADYDDSSDEKTITYRQPFGETASAALYEYLSQFGEQIAVDVWTAVDCPRDAFDTYGRLVGNVYVHVEKKLVNVNHWLLERGLVFPALYTSMRWEEMARVISLTKAARMARRGVWARYSRRCGPVDPRIVYRGKGAEPRQENGAIMVPKLFRRRVAWREYCRSRGEISFEKYLAERADQFVPLGELRNGGAARVLTEVVEGGELVVDPLNMVFEERAVVVR